MYSFVLLYYCGMRCTALSQYSTFVQYYCVSFTVQVLHLVPRIAQVRYRYEGPLQYRTVHKTHENLDASDQMCLNVKRLNIEMTTCVLLLYFVSIKRHMSKYNNTPKLGCFQPHTNNAVHRHSYWVLSNIR